MTDPDAAPLAIVEDRGQRFRLEVHPTGAVRVWEVEA